MIHSLSVAAPIQLQSKVLMETCWRRDLVYVDGTIDWRPLVVRHRRYLCWKGYARRQLESESPVPKNIISIRYNKDHACGNGIPVTLRHS